MHTSNSLGLFFCFLWWATDEYTLLGEGYCNDYAYLSIGQYPARLTNSDALYDADAILECRNRCLAEVGDANIAGNAFYLKNDENCACSTGTCSSQPSGNNPYKAYKIRGIWFLFFVFFLLRKKRNSFIV